jgi:isoquinoline 1-oxidoreductase alpha subunit
MSYTIKVNGATRTVEAEGDTPLLWVLRDLLDLKGTKFGCGLALCGCCTVHLDGAPIRACVTPIAAIGSKEVTTVEAVGDTATGKKVQEAWLALDVMQCGYCQAGQIMSATALLNQKPQPTERQHLPLRHLHAHPRRHQTGRRPADRRHEGGLT